MADKRLNKEVIDAVHTMYNDDEYISTAKNVHISKRQMLCNLRQLYEILKEKRPEIGISFSNFASLRSKWCVLVGLKGTYSLCVCVMHHNLKLILPADNFERNLLFTY